MICYEHQNLRHCQHMDHYGSALTKLLCEIWFMGNQFYFIPCYIYILYIIIYSQHLRVAHTATYTVN